MDNGLKQKTVAAGETALGVAETAYSERVTELIAWLGYDILNVGSSMGMGTVSSRLAGTLKQLR